MTDIRTLGLGKPLYRAHQELLAEYERLRAEVDLVIAQREAWRVSALTCLRSSAEFAADADRQRAKIAALEQERDARRAENSALASWQCIHTDGFTGLMHDECGNASCMKDREIAAHRANAERHRGLLLWALYHAQGGSSPVGQPIRKALGIGQFDHLTPEQVRDATIAGERT